MPFGAITSAFEGCGWVLPTILLTYYPTSYLHHVTRGPWLQLVEEKSSYDPSLLLLALFIIGPVLYHLLSRYSLLDTFKLVGRTVPQQNHNRTCNCADDSAKCSLHAERVKNPYSDIQTGLSSDEVSARRKIYGLNELWKGRNWGLWFLSFNSNSGQVFILANVVLAVTLHEWHHAGPACLLWLLMAYIPAYQQWSADSVVKSLLPIPSWPTIVLRDGKLQKVSSKDLVPGDLVHVSEGSLVPADGIVIAYDEPLQIDQSSITGETTSISKHEKDMCFWGTGVVLGDALLQIEHTGQETFIGRTVELVQGQDRKSEETKKSASTREYLTVMRLIGFILLVVLALPVLLWQTSTSQIASWPEILSLTADMAIIATRFFSTSTIKSIRARSAARLAEAGCILHSLEATETLAGIDTLCIDYSSVITEDRYTLVKPYCISCNVEDILLAASLSVPWHDRRNALDHAIAKALKQFPQAKARRDRYRIIDHRDIDSNAGQLYSECLVEAPDGTRSFFARGSLHALLELCREATPADHACHETLKTAVIKFRDHGLASLGIAQRQEGGDWQLLGALPFCDPPRQSTRSALKQGDELEVCMKVLSGWSDALVERVARAAGFESSLLNADMIDHLQKVESDELTTQINEANFYTDLSIRHKEMILTTLQDSGHRVAVTGDGAPHVSALRKADYAIAVAGATESAQSASDLVCVDKAGGLLPLIFAIKFSRRAHHYAHNYVVQQIARTLHILLAMLSVFVTDGKLLDLRLLLTSTTLIELVDLCFPQEIADTPCPKKPTRWNKRIVLKKVGLLVIAFMSGFCLCAYSFPSTERLQALSLLLVIGDLCLSLLLHTDGRVWRSGQSSKMWGARLAIYLVITAACVIGLAGDSFRMTIETAVRVWVYSIAFIVTAGPIKYAASTIVYAKEHT